MNFYALSEYCQDQIKTKICLLIYKKQMKKLYECQYDINAAFNLH